MFQQIGVNLDKNAISIIGTVSGPPGSPALQKNFFFAGNFKQWPMVKLCAVLKNALAKTPKIIPRNNEK